MIFCTDGRIHSCTIRASRSARMMDCALRKKHSCNATHESLFPFVRNPRIERRATVFGEASDKHNPSGASASKYGGSNLNETREPTFRSITRTRGR